jgi:maltose alpha-D-glucosyltransferase/alpha-amylase
MCFHFPVMPRIFYSLREERAKPIIDILAETPEIPSQGQWGTFLRNHDELTLEMVTTEERAAMYGWYAPDPRMRANIGIRRRLSTLLDGSRAEIELVNALLLSLPGSPCLYYGDEIGMGDNIWLADRDSVRTPMQWTPDRNAGFSTADPGKLYLPTVQSLVYHYGAVNVEAQSSISTSLLNWTRAMLATRKEHPVFGLGGYVPLEASNPHVLAFLRVLRDGEVEGEAGETVLCVNNLSSVPQATRIRMPEQAGHQLTDLFGGAGFETVPEDGWLGLSMGSRDFFWLGVTPTAASTASAAASGTSPLAAALQASSAGAPAAELEGGPGGGKG